MPTKILLTFPSLVLVACVGAKKDDTFRHLAWQNAPHITIAVVAQPADCSTQRHKLSWFEGANQGSVRVIGVILTRSQSQVDLLTGQTGLSFPLVRGGWGVERSLVAVGYRRTPVVVVLDARGRLRAAAPLAEIETAAAARGFVQAATGSLRHNLEGELADVL